MDNDTTFITNEGGIKLLDRFNTLVRNTQFFDCLVGYFYTSGFHFSINLLKIQKKYEY